VRPSPAFDFFAAPEAAPDASATGMSRLATVLTACTRWFGDAYDLDVMRAVCAVAAAERLSGDPVWLLVITGSGMTKTETVMPLAGAGAIITSQISSEAALLSGTAKKETAKDATGGLLRLRGSTGLLVVKDVTTILSMNRDSRAGLLAALREVYDGRWQRNVGADGGRTLEWQGRIGVIGAVTTAWDRAHDVIASMGDRFVAIRIDSTTGRQAAGLKALDNIGHEIEMRAELAEAVGRLIKTVDPSAAITLTRDEQHRIMHVADVVTRCRTAVEYDYRGDVIDAHAPEAPTRFAKQLGQVVRGAHAIGVPRDRALALALRCARDSMPPLRLAILEDVHRHPGATTQEVRRRLNKPRSTVDRQLQALHILEVLSLNETLDEARDKSTWHYYVADSIAPDVLKVPPCPEMSGGASDLFSEPKNPCGDISGRAPDQHDADALTTPDRLGAKTRGNRDDFEC